MVTGLSIVLGKEEKGEIFRGKLGVME